MIDIYVSQEDFEQKYVSRAAYDALLSEIAAKDQAIESLRAEIENARRYFAVVDDTVWDVIKNYDSVVTVSPEIVRLRAEIDALKSTLREYQE